MTPKPSGLLVVTDRTGSDIPLVERVEAALAGGVRWIWFRDRDLDAASRQSLAEDLIIPVRRMGAAFIVGGDVALACAIGADGVHLSGGAKREDILSAKQQLPSVCLIGISAHSPAEIDRAAELGVDYATLSPIFETQSKPGYGPALGPAALQSDRRREIPVLALGGISPLNTRACRNAGFAGIAIMGGVMRAKDPEGAVRAYREAWEAPG
ncbi:thiamine phosphate synthase [Methylobacterium sp. CM6244]